MVSKCLPLGEVGSETYYSATAVVGVSGREPVENSTTSTLGMERSGLQVSAMGKVFSIHSRYDDPSRPFLNSNT